MPKIDYEKIRVPFLSNKKIKFYADSFRKDFWGKSIPVDIESIVELKLKINIITVPGLYKLSYTDAIITSDWTSIYADKYRYENREKRFRFSLAHEIGHFVLHKRVYKNLEIKDLKDFYEFLREFPVEHYRFFEIQANKFANYLLVPREQLIIEREKALSIAKKTNMVMINKITDKEMLNSYLAIPIAKVFNVSEIVIRLALRAV